MARVLVLGGGGMAGHMARIVLAERGHTVFSVARTKSEHWDSLDVEDTHAIEKYLADKRPEIIVNCVGVLIKESDSIPERAIRINALLPHVLSRLGGDFGFRLIHLSSDCVFSGRSGPYKENSIRDPNDLYGRTKALGEIVNNRDLTIRTSIIGPELKLEGSGLFNWFMSQRGSVKGFTRAMWGGVTTLELAKAIDAAIRDRTTGLVHLTSGNPISKHDLLMIFKELWNRSDIQIERDDLHVSDRSLINTRIDYFYKVPSYRVMLEEMKSFMAEHQELYRLYEKTTSCH